MDWEASLCQTGGEEGGESVCMLCVLGVMSADLCSVFIHF